jgi:HNH endonuclease
MGMTERKRQKRIRKNVIDRDGYVCCYCNQILTEENLTLDHIIPVSKRGMFNATNLTVSCAPCNNNRGSQPFFDYIKSFNFSDTKIRKYKSLYFNNLRIKVLNIAKEECIYNDYEIPQDLIERACDILKIKSVNYDEFANKITISFHAFHLRNEIVYAFENLIHLIEDKAG